MFWNRRGHTLSIMFEIVTLAILLLAGVASAEVIQVNISVENNNINLQSNREVTVDILSTPDFNASDRVNISTVTFVGASVENTGDGSIYQDVNHDSLIDIGLKFKLENTLIQCVDLRGYLFGTTYDGQTIYGSDIIHITRPKSQGDCTPTLGGPNITSFDPNNSLVMNNVSESRNFSIRVDQTVNVFWYIGINGNPIQANGSVNESMYTNNSASLGGWNVIVYANNSNGSDARSWGWIVSRVNTNISVTSSSNPSTFGQPVTFTATVVRAVSGIAPGAGTPTGAVEFFNGSTSLGSVSLTGFTATLLTSALGIGSNSITAVYRGDNNFSTSTSLPLTQTVVNKTITTIVWSNPANITYGTALSGIQLNATASVPGIFVYDPVSGTVLSVGDNQNLHVDFTPTDAANYTGASADVTINVLKATPMITWNNPSDIVYGTALSSAQLDATASVPGSFIYTPESGTVLGAGTQTLHAEFTPSDAANYTGATKNVTLIVREATPTPAPIPTPTPAPAPIPGEGSGGTIPPNDGTAGTPPSNGTSVTSPSIGTPGSTTATRSIISATSTNVGSGCGRNVQSKENITNIKQQEYTREVDVRISGGETVFTFTTLSIINGLGFTPKTNEGCITAKGELLKGRPTQATSDAPGTVYFNVWVGPTGYSESSKIENSYVIFSVPDEKNNENVKLMMLKDGSWINLKTEKIGAGTYKAYTSGFGSFAISTFTEAETSAVAQPTSPAAITEIPSSPKPMNWNLIIIVFVLIATAVAVYSKRENITRVIFP